MAIDPAAFRRKFRKMAASPFAFYRGSAALFYADQLGDFADDRFLDERTSRVWIHGDLHAENFGTYMNASGQLVFNVNDFDEAYVGPFTWDLQAARGQRGAARLRQGALRHGDRRAGRRLRPVVPDRAAGDRRRWRRRDRLDHPGQRRRGAAPGAPAGPAQHPRRPAGRADHHRQLRATVLHRRRGLRDRRRRPGTGSAPPSRTTWAPCRPPRRSCGRWRRGSRTWCCARGWASARPGCRRTTCCWRGTPRRWRTTSSST